MKNHGTISHIYNNVHFLQYKLIERQTEECLSQHINCTQELPCYCCTSLGTLVQQSCKSFTWTLTPDQYVDAMNRCVYSNRSECSITAITSQIHSNSYCQKMTLHADKLVQMVHGGQKSDLNATITCQFHLQEQVFMFEYLDSTKPTIIIILGSYISTSMLNQWLKSLLNIGLEITGWFLVCIFVC